MSNVHVLHPYNTTGHTNTFTTPFFNVLLNPFVKSSFSYIMHPLPSQSMTTSIWLRSSSVITQAKYLKLLTCFRFSVLQTGMLTILPPFQQTTIVFVFLRIIFHAEVFGSIFQFICLCNFIHL